MCGQDHVYADAVREMQTEKNAAWLEPVQGQATSQVPTVDRPPSAAAPSRGGLLAPVQANPSGLAPQKRETEGKLVGVDGGASPDSLAHTNRAARPAPAALPAYAESSAAPHAAPLPLKPNDDDLEGEIARLKEQFVRRGGRDPEIMEAILALEREVGVLGRPGRRRDAAGAAGAIAAAGGLNAPHWRSASQQEPNAPYWRPAPQQGMGRWGAQPTSRHMEAVRGELDSTEAAIRSQLSENERLQAQLAQQRDRLQQDASRHPQHPSYASAAPGQMAAPAPGLPPTAPPPQQQQQPFMQQGVADAVPAGWQDRASAAGEPDPASLALTKEEEEELLQLERLPKNSELYRLRKKHLSEMLTLKYELERLKQESEKENLKKQVELMRKEQERREWKFQQEQQLLEAKYRKHIARERPVQMVQGGKTQVDETLLEEYSAQMGLTVYFDFVLGLPTKVLDQVQMVYGFFSQGKPLSQPKALPLVDVERGMRRAVPAVKRGFMQVVL